MAAFPALAETAAKETEPAEWTVLFYFCGAELESHHGFVSEQLQKISQCFSPYRMLYDLATILGVETTEEDLSSLVTVNVAFQTGGSKKWDNEKSGLEISADALQRWSYTYDSEQYYNVFNLEQELPLQSMGDPETLSDFIRWGTQTYPANKYALVLWGHGDGAKTGIFVDELFNNDVMNLKELGQALTDGGVFFEAVLLDACMMANLETASAIQHSAAWMISSEEVVPGSGTAVSGWLQELFNNPWQDGKQLGRNICDMTEIYYANTDNYEAKDLLTWSVIDLSKIERVNKIADEFFKSLNNEYTSYPSALSFYVTYLYDAEDYGDTEQNMRDIASIFYRSGTTLLMDWDTRNEMINALNDAVVYSLRGPGRSEARGLSFCYATDFSNAELDTYANNCMSPNYLAFLDAITPWTAPDWVYETAERLPEIGTMPVYDIIIEKCMSAQGVPGIQPVNGYLFGGMNYVLYRLDEKTNKLTRLGKTVCRTYSPDGYTTLYSAVDPWLWPSIDGEFCDIELVSATDTQALYSVPMRIGADIWFLRYSRQYERHLDDLSGSEEKNHLSQYTVYGLWEGYDDDTVMLCRNIKSLSQMAGQQYRLLYPVDNGGSTGKTKYINGKEHTLYRSLVMEAKTLPAGTYYLEYEVLDMFMRPITMEKIEMYWDGKNLSFPPDFTWEGTIQLKWE